MIEEQFVSLDTARMLKEAGFDVPCTSQYTENEFAWENLRKTDFNKNGYVFSRPTLALAARWLRETHAIDIVIGVGDARFYYVRLYQRSYLVDMNTIFKPTYEEALEAGLREAIKLIKK